MSIFEKMLRKGGGGDRPTDPPTLESCHAISIKFVITLCVETFSSNEHPILGDFDYSPVI
jgi:hypothetical protein